MYLREAYALTGPDAAARAAGFVLLAAVARPVGRWLADRFGGARLLVWAFGVVAVGAVVVVVAAFGPVMAPSPWACSPWRGRWGPATARRSPSWAGGPRLTRSARSPCAGGATGGLGGFLPPIVMGVVLQLTGSYAIGLMLLSAVALASLVFTALRLYRADVPAAPPSAPPLLAPVTT